MAKSKIISLLVFLWQKIVVFYESSLIARGIGAFLDFFKSRANGSFFVRLFRHGAFGGNSFEQSLTNKAINRVLTPKKTIRPGKSSILDFLFDIINVPLYKLGLILLAYGIPMVLKEAVMGSTKFELIVSLSVLALGIIFIILRKTLLAVYSGSLILRWIGSLFCDMENIEPKEREFSIKPYIIGSFFIGLVGAFISPVMVTLSILAGLCISLIIARFEIGVFLILFLAAFLPTALIAGLTVLTLVGFFASLITGRLKTVNLSRVFPLILIYLIFAVFATFTSPKLSSSLFVLGVYTVFILAYIMIINTVNTKAKWRVALSVFLISAFFISLYGIYQNFFMDATVQGWVDQEMFEDISTRVYATFDNPNVLGQYFIITIPVIFSLLFLSKGIGQKFGWGIVLLSSVMCLLYTWSRGAWVGVMLGVMAFLLLRDRRWIALGVLGLVLLPFVLPESILDRLLSIGNMADSSTAYRVSVWIASWRMAIDFWALGIGYGSDAFASVYSLYALNGANYALHAHNFYLQMVADVGIVGLVSYILIVMSALRDITYIKRDRMMKGFAIAFAGVLAGYLFQGIAESLWYNMRMSLMFWIVIAFIESAYNIEMGAGE